MLSTVRLTWCMMDTVDGAARGNNNRQQKKNDVLKDGENQSRDNTRHLGSFGAVRLTGGLTPSAPGAAVLAAPAEPPGTPPTPCRHRHLDDSFAAVERLIGDHPSP